MTNAVQPYFETPDGRIRIYCADAKDVRQIVQSPVHAIVTDPPYGLEFMGKDWDGSVPPVEHWRAYLEILRPGAHLLAFAGTRTQHRMACAIEDAGFEIRDMLAWVYGSGFPKSMDVSKAIDKAAGAERPVVGSRKLHGTARIKGKAAYGGTSGRSDEAYAEAETINETLAITAPATEAAKQWQGWGTALKPALEPITLARVPFAATIADNIQRHGTSAINVDGCRVGETVETWPKSRSFAPGISSGYTDGLEKGETQPTGTAPPGRWPANLMHDGSPEVVSKFPGADVATSAARFFYCPKASKSERGEGNNHPTVKPIELMRYLCRLITPPDGIILDPYMGSGTTGIAAAAEGFRFIGIERSEAYCEIARRRIFESLKGSA
jgi:hypothetical protein